jgi:hypothetical protein
MILRKAVLLLAAIAATSTIARAQFGVYGTVTVNRLSGQQNSPFAPVNNPLTASACAQIPLPQTCQVNNSVDPIGGSGGIYYDFMKLGPVRLGADLRGTITNSKQGAYTFSRGGGTRIYSTLGGIRASFHTPIRIIKPYIQGSVGLGRSDYGLYTNGPAIINNDPGTQLSGIVVHNNFQYEGFAGVDLKLLPIMDFRVVELGYGALTGGGHTYPIGSLSSGVVFHLPF